MMIEIDVNSPTWKTVSGKARAVIDEAQLRLERRGYDATETEFERGRIETARAILKLADPPQVKPAIPQPPPY
ncbi:MAG: hypothetical protein FJX55_03555 [Alphaproteobacteria bacterium]|nr:hypothetical protein [Alphaproteobacteria bacterium]